MSRDILIPSQDSLPSLLNIFITPGWGSEATFQVHFLEIAERRTRLVILGSNRISHWTAQTLTLITRWFGYWWIGRRHKQFKLLVEALKGSTNLSV